MAITISTFDSAASAALDFYVRGEAMAQNLLSKPLVKLLTAKQKTFPGGNANVKRNVQGSWVSGSSSFFQGYSTTDTVAYANPDFIKQASYPWKEIHAGINIAMTTLKQDGISVVDSCCGDTVTKHSDRDMTVITNMLENKMQDFVESWAIKFNDMVWGTGAQDSKQVPGLRSILTDTPNLGTTGTLDRATNTWWRHRSAIDTNKVSADPATQALTRKLRYEIRQLKKYGSEPDAILAGSDFIDALELEVQAKGNYTLSGFAKGQNDIGMSDIRINGVGTITYDPTLDNMGLSKRAYVVDTDSIVLYVMEGEDKKIHTPARPFDQYAILRAMTWTGALCAWQLNSSGVYEVA